MSADLWRDLKDRQEAIERSLRAEFALSSERAPRQLTSAMEHSLFAPGKRLRPTLTLLACESVGGNFQQALPAACAVELVHTYSLIHDDLPAMDDDDLRRGLPTCHKKFGEALAILAGDALLTMAFEVIGRSYSARTAAVSCVELASGAGARGMVGGQVLDLEAEGRISDNSQNSIGIGSLEAIHRRKTGALFRSAMRLGIYTAQVETSEQRAIEAADNFAQAFGLAFQVTDDLLDVQGNSDVTGKRVGKDAARGKLTYPVLLGIDESRQRAVQLVQEAVEAARFLRSELLEKLAMYVIERDR